MTIDSKFIPNSFQYPNAYVDKYMALLTPNENLVLTYAIRRIIGFQKESDRISISQFSTGIVNSKGVRLDYGTGLGESAVRSAVTALVKYKILKVVTEFDKRENLPNEYGLQWDDQSVDMAGLQERRGEKRAADSLRTKGIHPPGSTDKVGVPRFDGQGRPGSTDTPGPGSTDDTHNIPVETQKKTRKDSATKPAAPSEPTPKVTSAQQLMFQALADVTMMDMKLNGSRIGKAATELISAGYTPEQVTALYLPGGLWYSRDWRGQRGDPPSLPQIKDTIKALMDPAYQDAPAHKNNGRMTTFERNMAGLNEIIKEMSNE